MTCCSELSTNSLDADFREFWSNYPRDVGDRSARARAPGKLDAKNWRRHYTFVRPFSFNCSADSGAFFFW
jgi:hypothetical protein